MMTELVWIHASVTTSGRDFSKRLSHGLTPQANSMKLTFEQIRRYVGTSIRCVDMMMTRHRKAISFHSAHCHGLSFEIQ